MPLADSSYPLLGLFWSMFIFFLWLLWMRDRGVIIAGEFEREKAKVMAGS